MSRRGDRVVFVVTTIDIGLWNREVGRSVAGMDSRSVLAYYPTVRHVLNGNRINLLNTILLNTIGVGEFQTSEELDGRIFRCLHIFNLYVSCDWHDVKVQSYGVCLYTGCVPR